MQAGRMVHLRQEVIMSRLAVAASAICATLALAGCELIGNIFEAGVWTGVIIVVAVVVGIGFLVTRLFR
jgi:hypothetical protein